MRTKSCGFVASVLMLGAGVVQAGQVATYFPLHVGNSWTYANAEGATRTFAIVGQRQLGAETYYEFSDYFSPCGFPGSAPPPPDHYLFRYAPDADVLLQYDPARKTDIVRYDLSGRQWGPFGNEMTGSGFSQSVPAGDFDDCVKFEYATLVDCGVFNESVAPHVGTIEFYSSWDGTFQLQGYTIVPEPASWVYLVIAGLVWPPVAPGPDSCGPW